MPWVLWGWIRSCKGDTSSQAEKLVRVKVYWTLFVPGLFTVASLQPAGGAGGLQRPCSCPPPLLPSRSSVGCSEKVGGWVEGRGWRLIISPTHLGPSPSPQSLPEIPQSSCPTDRSCPALGAPSRPVLWPATCLVCARWPCDWMPGSEGRQWGLLRTAAPPHSSSEDTPRPPPHRWSLTPPRHCEHPSPSGEEEAGNWLGWGPRKACR